MADEISGKYGVDVTGISKDLFHPEAALEIYDEVNSRYAGA